MTRHYCSLSGLLFLASLCLIVCPCVAFPKKKAINSSSTQFSRKRVILHHDNQHNNLGVSSSSSSSSSSFPSFADSSTSPHEKRQKALLKMDAVIGIAYSVGFFLFPRQTLSTFFTYDFDPSIQPLLNLAVRMIALNHIGYVAGVLLAPPQKAIRVATAFLTIVGIFIVYYGQAMLETAAVFWTCTVLTTALIVAHFLAL